MKASYRALVDTIAADDTSGATDIVLRAADLLRRLLGESDRADELIELAQACVRAQPSMAGLLALEALSRGADWPAIQRFQEQVRRAPAAIARHASQLLLLDARPSGARRSMQLITCSSSRAVESTLLELADAADLLVCCAESRPRREGTGLANRLASAGIPVHLFSDAGISSAVRGSDAVLVGADAVGPEFFINKVGTGAICALATSEGVPVYVLAGREKVLNAEEIARLQIAEGPPGQLVESAQPGLVVRNPYFERIPLGLATMIVSDSGVRPIQIDQ